MNKEQIKIFFPPIIWDCLKSFKTELDFLKYKQLIKKNEELKDIHKGKRCFILGSGPSIKEENLKPLKNEIVFALNNFYVHEDFQEIMGGDCPKYYMTAPIHPPQTEDEWKSWFEDMEKYIPQSTKLCFGVNRYKQNTKYILNKYSLFKQQNIYWYFAGKQFPFKDHNISKGTDISKAIFEAEAVSIYALTTAIYMGFDEIYLLGMDHNYLLFDRESEMRMYSSAIHQENEIEKTFGNTFYVAEYLRQYNIFNKYYALNKYTNAKIFNLSSTSLLKIFPNKSLIEVLR